MKNGVVLLKLFRLAVLVALVTLIPLAVLGLVYRAQPDAYQDSYYAALPRKVERLNDVPGPRLVVVGGSSVAFGVDSKLAEAELGMPCVNFGLYAAFGLEPMLDLSLSRLHRGDIVVIAPETSAQMYAPYRGYQYLLQAFETRPGLLLGLGPDYAPGLAAKIPAYVRDARRLRAQGGAPNAGVYALSSFDAAGDIVYPRPENVMARGYIEDNLPELTPSIVTDAFLDMINDYARAARRRGATVYFAFCPINALSLGGSDPAAREAFEAALRAGLQCPILSPLEDHIMDAGYFYDSNYHLNDAGARWNTLALVGDVQRVLGAVRPTAAARPNPPALNQDGAVLGSGEEYGFLYDLTAAGAVVTGLDAAAASQRALVVPDTLGDAPVITVAAGALSGSAAEELALPSTIERLPGRLFEGMERLTEVTLLSEQLPEVGDQLLTGAGADLTIRVPAAAYSTYVTDYFWGLYAAHIEAIQ